MEVPDENYSKPKELQITKPEAPQRPPPPRTQPQPIPLNKNGRRSENGHSSSSAAERLREFKDPDYLAAKEVELGSSAESDGIPTDHMERVRKHASTLACGRPVTDQEGSDFRVSGPDLMSFEDSDEVMPGSKVDPAVDVLSEMDPNQNRPVSRIETTPPRDPSREANSPTSDFVFVTDNEVKDAMKSAVESVQRFSPHSPRRMLRGLRDGKI